MDGIVQMTRVNHRQRNSFPDTASHQPLPPTTDLPSTSEVLLCFIFILIYDLEDLGISRKITHTGTNLNTSGIGARLCEHLVLHMNVLESSKS